ncbi:deoxyribodipyrimidine photo-lyase, partial [Vibrio sp.]|uniref:deoxyribodipyrimidine photo-lyase n=1 Tax=Vibrio sp. TaxID=678 RepID=UPI003D105666
MQIVWFRRDLRVEDNTALQQAIASGDSVVAVYIATPVQWDFHHLAPVQADLIYRRLSVLQQDLASLNIELLYFECDDFEAAASELADFAEQSNAQGVWLNKEYELNEVRRDQQLQWQLASIQIELHSYDDKCAFAPGQILNKQGQYFKVFTPFKKAYLKQYYQRPPQISKTEAAPVWDHADQWQDIRWSEQQSFRYPRVTSNHYSVDSKEILTKLRHFCHQAVDDYHQQRDFPAQAGTSQLSAYLAIGALSVRQCMVRLHYQHPELNLGRQTWLSELVWREFYQHLLYFEPKLSRGESFLPWGQNLRWLAPSDALTAWQKGCTGYPIVDAAMRQLNQTGWMHNRLRMVVASFLTKDLHIDWHHGEAYFMSCLIDGDYAANNGGWQWCASTGCDGQPYFRIFNPISQGEKFDPDGAFVRHWLPELSEVPNRWIHQPWRWEGFETVRYPEPIVD